MRLYETVRDWVLDEGRMCVDPAAFLDGMCHTFARAGTPLARCNVQVRTLHPDIGIRLFSWCPPDVTPTTPPRRGVLENRLYATAHGQVREVALEHAAFVGPAYLSSPFYPAVERGEIVRVRIKDLGDAVPYPIISDLRAIGVTDYVSAPLTPAHGPRSGMSFATALPDGFDDAAFRDLVALLPVLSLVFELHTQRNVTRSLVRTYVGQDPGRAVLAGQIQRGDVRTLRAALWFSDLRGYTQMSESTDPQTLITTLNAYFAALTSPLGKYGGEVLKYIGDATLVVFPVRDDRDERQACRDAVTAAEEAGTALDALNAERTAAGQAQLEHGIGLHFGQAQYGNIGAPGRLDFTVIGRDVNHASRVEGLCGKLGKRVLATEAVTSRVSERGWDTLGQFPLKGIDGQHPIAAPAAAPR